MSSNIDPALCPICDQPNRCGEINPENQIDGRCWCAFETFPREIFELVPEDKRNKTCICKRCLDRFKSGELSSPSVNRS